MESCYISAPCSSVASAATLEVVQSVLIVCGLVLSMLERETERERGERERQSRRGTNIGRKKESETKTDSSLRDCDQIGLI